MAYHTITITNNSGGAANVTVSSSLVGGGACGDANDTFFSLYNGSFDPAAPSSACLAVNDDISGPMNRCSSLSFSIPDGSTRIVVVAGFNNANSGGLFAYQINFTASGVTPTATNTDTPTPTDTPTATPTPTPTDTAMPSPTATYTATSTATPTAPPSAAATTASTAPRSRGRPRASVACWASGCCAAPARGRRPWR